MTTYVISRPRRLGSRPEVDTGSLTPFQKALLATLAGSALLVALVLAARGAAVAATAPAVTVATIGQIPPGIVTTGDATVRIRPDIAVLSVGAVAQGATAQEAQRAVAARVARILDQAKALGIAEKDIMDAGYRIEPQYAYGQGQAPRITGYQATEQVTLTLRDVNAAGKAVDALVQGDGANTASVRFALEDPKAAQADARALAIADARAKAAAMASAAGVAVGRVIAVSDESAPQPVSGAYEKLAVTAATQDTRIPVGDLDVVVRVRVQLEIR